MNMEPRKEAILDALTRFMNQRSGIEFGNYGDVKIFRAEQRSIYTDLKHARVLLAAVKWRDGITWRGIVKAAKGAYSGRLTITATPNYRDDASSPFFELQIDYCTGQNFPTEYRRAVCAVLASALWEYTREHAMPAPGMYGVKKWGDNRTWYALETSRELVEKDLASRDGDRFGHIVEAYALRGPCERITWVSAGDWLRAHFRKEFGRAIAQRWFS
jgi:hypothetical protein